MSTTQKIRCSVFVSLAAILTYGDSFAHEPKVSHTETAEVIEFPGHATRVLADFADTDGGTSVLSLTIPPKTFGAPPHIHSKEDEYFYVLEGNMKFLDRDKVVDGSVGDLLILPRGNLHGFWNDSEQPARLLLIVTPGEFAAFFDEVVQRIKRENATTPERIGALISEAATQRGVEIRPNEVPAEARHLLAP